MEHDPSFVAGVTLSSEALNSKIYRNNYRNHKQFGGETRKKQIIEKKIKLAAEGADTKIQDKLATRQVCLLNNNIMEVNRQKTHIIK